MMAQHLGIRCPFCWREIVWSTGGQLEADWQLTSNHQLWTGTVIVA